ncbi:sigma-70 family RNA polymerase sigma factor [Georgenia sp. Z1491]|uniref:sigma-70 family RNA polymerase sigma factor n=1 Tax=Georgenia sp. Z1491 TaxID=3416707 RepID=UPI003CF4F167
MVTSEAHPAPAVSAEELDGLRQGLTGLCYRMLGDAHEAEDAVQETLVRLWRSAGSFDPARGSLRSWAYAAASRVCIDLHRRVQRRALPMDLTGPSSPETPLAEPEPERWVTPIADSRSVDPAERAVGRESLRVAFVLALQRLSAQQRAVLLLRDVYRMSAAETGEALGLSASATHSTLRRARQALRADAGAEAGDGAGADAGPGDGAGAAPGTGAGHAPGTGAGHAPGVGAGAAPGAAARLPSGAGADAAPVDEALLARYQAAFEAHDVDLMRAVLHEDVRTSMPPFSWWLDGRAHVLEAFATPGGCQGHRLVPFAANGTTMFGQYRPEGAGWVPFAVLGLETDAGRVRRATTWLDAADRFAELGLPERLGPRS